MIVYPNVKINLGLNVIRKREDSYHDLESVFHPIPFCDVLEITESSELEFINTGITVDAPMESNLCVKAWKLLQEDYNIPNVRMHLHKQIPFGAGLGGGSADASFSLKALNEIFKLNISESKLEEYALQLGSDCPFFIKNETSYTWGRGEFMESYELNLSSLYFMLFNPSINVGTAQAYAGLIPKQPEQNVREILKQPIEQWKDSLHNDFEDSIFTLHPEIGELKAELYKEGAVYASMSGSGSSVFAFFKEEPVLSSEILKKFLIWEGSL